MSFFIHVFLPTSLIIALIALIFWQRRTHRARIEESLRRDARDAVLLERVISERNALLDALGEAFLLINQSGIILFANAYAHKMLGARRIEGRRMMETFLDDRVSKGIMQSIETNTPLKKRIIIQSGLSTLGGSQADSQKIRAWQLDAAPFVSFDKETMTRVILRDMTKEYEAETIRKDFVANASHELRTPMSIINGYLENLLEDGMLDDQKLSQKFLLTMQKHGKRISRIIDDMLMIAKMESGEVLTLKCESFVFSECLHDVLERLDSIVTKQNATVIVDITPPSLSLHADRFYWTQILFNLIENALKQNPLSPLTLTIKAALSPNKQSIHIEVCDNGVGIPAASLPYIFKRFYRVEKHHNQSAIKGTGLGLSIVRRAVEAHQGSIQVHSIPGKKTCFSISLPPAQSIESSQKN